MRALLQNDNATYHCSGSDTLLGSANVAASIFILLLLGFVGGVSMTVMLVWFNQRKQRKLDLEYRDRNKSKTMGDIPDVEDLIKSARFVTDSDDGVYINLSEDAVKSSLHFNGEGLSTAPGPLQGGSQRCVNLSMEGNKSLLRSSKDSLSHAEDVNPHASNLHSRTISNVTDPESPLPNVSIPPIDGKKYDSQNSMAKECIDNGKNQATRIGSEIYFEEGSRLDGSASCILVSNPKKMSSFDPPFESAWRRNSVDQNVTESIRKSSDSMRSSISDMKAREGLEDIENQLDAVHNNPFATTEAAIKEVADAIRQMT